MLYAKKHAAQTAEYSRSSETFGPDRVVFFSDPGGTVLWLPAGEPDPPVWALTERTLAPSLQSARLGCWLEGHVVMAELSRPSPG
jgi:hypothetical protein